MLFFTSSKRLLLIIFPVVVLSACASPEQRQAWEREQQYKNQQAAQAAAQRLINQCDGYGFKRGTTAFSQCLQQAAANEQAQATMDAMARKGTPADPQYWFNKSRCYSTGRLDC